MALNVVSLNVHHLVEQDIVLVHDLLFLFYPYCIEWNTVRVLIGPFGERM
jgi:hypothetical protein